MVRGNKLKESKKRPGKTAEQLLETILEDVIKAAALSFEEWRSLSRSPFVSLAIPISSGEEYRVTRTGVDAAHELTRQTWQTREDLRQTVARSEFDKFSFSAIGQTIKSSREHLPNDENIATDTQLEDSFFAALAKDYCLYLDNLADKARPDVDQHIACHLFHSNQNVPAFAVGPVLFRPRAEWLDAFVKHPAERASIEQVEVGTLTMSKLREQALAPNSDRTLYNAWSVLNSLRGFEWVGTIRMPAHALTRSHNKASIIVSLAIDALGLRFQVEDARRFVKAGRQHLFSGDRLATSAGGTFHRGASIQMPGLGSKPGALAKKMKSERAFLDAAGCILDTYMQGRQTGRAPHLVERWVNALYWVGEARREVTDFMAVVNYGCAADGLSGAGGEAKKMTEFAEAALNPKGAPALQGALSIADAVTTVYREGRNKLAHGESPGLLEDLEEPRVIGDLLLSHLFDSVTVELAVVIKTRKEILTLDEKHAYRAFQERLRQRT